MCSGPLKVEESERPVESPAASRTVYKLSLTFVLDQFRYLMVCDSGSFDCLLSFEGPASIYQISGPRAPVRAHGAVVPCGSGTAADRKKQPSLSLMLEKIR